MKRPSFLNGVCAAAALAFISSVAVAVLTPIFAFSLLYKLLVPALGLAYIGYLLSRSSEKVGWVTTLTLWIAFSIIAWWIEPPLTLYILMHVGAVWLIRSLYFYSSVLPALMDLGLNVFSMATAFWAIGHTGSTFLAVWCFFLVQALFVSIPPALGRAPGGRGGIHTDRENFERARHRAEAAIRQLLAQ
jgi:hypothetical protein